MQRVLSFPASSRGWGDQREFVSKRMCFAFMFALGFLAFLGGFLLGRFVFDKELELSRIKFKEASRNKEKVFGVIKNYSRFNVSSMVEGISESSLQQYLRLLTDQSSGDSASDNLREAEILRNHLTSNGFDLVSSLSETHTQMAYPSSQFPNEVVVINDRGETVLRINDTREKYSGWTGKLNTTTVEGSIIYVNYGRNEDYQYLDYIDARYRNKIILLRAGEITVAEKVANSVERGVKGILIFSDFDPTDMELPLISPSELATLQTRYGNLIDKWAGTIPILEISASDARELFKRMSSQQTVPSSWKRKQKGYKIGPGFSEPVLKIRMRVSTATVIQTFYSTLGAMKGSQEPDRFVMLTNEKDLGSNDVKSTSIIMELVRVLGNLKSKGWTPHRSIVIAFWGVEGPNLHLSSYPNGVIQHILQKTVTYFEIDSFDQTEKNLTLAAVTPMMEKLFHESAMTVPLSDPSADILSPLATDNLFIQCGIPFLKMKNFSSKNLKDIATFWGVTTWRMIDSYKLPFSLDTYSKLLAHSVDVIEERFKTTAEEHSLLLAAHLQCYLSIITVFIVHVLGIGTMPLMVYKLKNSLFQSVHRLIATIKSFEDNWSRADTSKSLEMRIMSDHLLDFSRFLLCGSDSNPSNQSAGESIFSRSVTGTDEEAGFGKLQDLLQDVMSGKNSQFFEQQVITHLANLVDTINLTRETLGDGLETLVVANT